MTTALDIINLAMRDSGVLGVGQTLLPEDINDGLTRLNFMYSEWQRKRWIVYHLVDTAFLSTGANTYSVGPGGDFPLDPRPDRLEAAYFVQTIPSQPNQVSYPLKVISSYEDYSRIALKQLVTFPEYVFLDTGYPTATLRPYPVPQSGLYTIHLITKAILTQFTLAATLSLPLEYFSALHLNLAYRLCMAYNKPPRADLEKMARQSMNVLRMANTQIPSLTLPKEVVRRGIYNVFSDQTY